MTASTSLQRRLTTDDPSATRELGERLARVAVPGDVISLIGELGAGKTQLAKGFGRGLGVPTTVTSPSFILMAEYAGRLPVFHLDLYRLADAAEALAGGLIDERQAEGVTLIEWAERLADALPAGRLEILIEGSGEEPRTITLRTADPRYARYLDAAEAGA